MFNRSRAVLAAALAAAFSPIAAAASLLTKATNPFSAGTPARRSRARAGKSIKRGFRHPVTGKLVKFRRPAAPFVPSPQDGLHWEDGSLVGPARGAASLYGPLGKLESKRKPAKARVRAQKPKQYASPKAEARALRRSGAISARQQRKLRRLDPRLTAPTFYGVDIKLDARQGGNGALQSLGGTP